MYKLPDRKPHERRGMMYDDVMVTAFNYYVAHEGRPETINHNLIYKFCMPLEKDTVLFPLEFNDDYVTFYNKVNANHTALRYQVVERRFYRRSPMVFIGFNTIIKESDAKIFSRNLYLKSKYYNYGRDEYHSTSKVIVPVSDIYSLFPIKLQVDPGHFIVSYIKIEPHFFDNKGVLDSRKTLKNINLERYYADPEKYHPCTIYEF